LSPRRASAFPAVVLSLATPAAVASAWYSADGTVPVVGLDGTTNPCTGAFDGDFPYARKLFAVV